MINFDWRSADNNDKEGRPLKRSTMLSIIALTTLTSMTVTGCAQSQSQTKQDEDKDEKHDQQSSSGHGIHWHGSHYGGSATVGGQAREKEFGRGKGNRTSIRVKSSGYQAPPANAWGGVSRGWFGRFCGSVFGG